MMRRKLTLAMTSPGHECDDGKEWGDTLPFPKLTYLQASIASFALAVVCFANSYNAEFVFDDSEALLNNKDLRPETPLQDLFYHDFWGGKLASKVSHKSYRPLTVLTFRFNYWLVGGLYPKVFHITNLFLHGLVCVLFLQVFSLVLGSAHSNCRTGKYFASPRASLLCSLLFASHPIHTESVSGVVGRADLLCALFFLLSFLSYVKSCRLRPEKSVYRPRTFAIGWMLLSMILCAVAVLFKEQGITILGICSVYDVIVQCRVDPINLLGLDRKSNTKTLSSIKNGQKRWNNYDCHCIDRSEECHSGWKVSLIQRHMCLMLTGAIILVLRWKIMGSAPPVFQTVDNPHSFINGTIHRTINYNYLYSLNLWLLLNPWWLCFDWSMGCVPVITSLSDLRILAPLIFWLTLGAVLWVKLKTWPHTEQRVLVMSSALLVVPFLPASNLLFRVGFVIAERVLYLSCAGFVMLVVLGAVQLSAFQKYKRIVRWFLPFLVVLFSARAIQRSSEWKTEEVLFASGTRVCPLNAKVHYNIAKINGDRANEDYAIKKYRQAIELNPTYDQAMNNLANILKNRGELIEAEELLEKAVKFRPEFSAAWMNLGIVQAALKKNASAEYSYFMALKNRKKYPNCYYNLGNLYLDMQRHKDALDAWRNATRQDPTHSSAWSNMLILLDNLDQLEELRVVAKEAIHHNPNTAALYYNYANGLGKAGEYVDSEQNFLKAIEKAPFISDYHSNLAVLYHRWGKLENAEREYKKALELNPKSAGATENLQMLYKKLNKSPDV